MKLKNSDVTPILLTLLIYKEGKEFSGLLLENIPLSLKRRLQKIRKDLLLKSEELQKDFEEVKDKPEEIKILLDEEFELNHEFVSLEMIEAINSSVNYDFDIIEKIAK
jgi:hypothetical protein